MSRLTHLFLFGCLVYFQSQESLALARSGGSHAGNGGDVIYCENPGQPTTVKMLDLFDAKIFENRNPDRLEIASSTNPYEMLEGIVRDIEKISPMRGSRYAEALNKFQGRIQWVSYDLVDIPDSEHLVLPVGCHIRQIAIQDRTGSEPHYTIDQRLWNMLDPINQAVLILHEITYGEALDEGAVNSIGTRRFVGFLISEWSIGRGQIEEFFDRLIKNGFKKQLDLRLDDGTIIAFHHISPRCETRYDPCQSLAWSACQIIFKDGTKVGSCKKGDPEKWPIGVITDRYRSLSGFGFDPSRYSAVEGAPHGLPVPVYSATFGEEFSSTMPFQFNDGFFDVTCRAKHEVKLKDQRRDYYKKTPRNIEKFDLTQSKLSHCSLDPTYPNRIFLFGKWRPVSSFELDPYVARTHEEFLTGNYKITFSKPQSLELFGQSLLVNQLESRITSYDGTVEQATEIIQLEKELTWNFLSYSCQVQKMLKINLNRGEIQSLELQFTQPCLIPSPGGDLMVTSAILDKYGKPIGDVELFEEAFLKVASWTLPVSKGKISFSPKGDLRSGTLAEDRELPVREYMFGKRKRLIEGRKVYAGTRFYLYADNDSFSVEGTYYADTPRKLLLTAWDVKNGRFVYAKENPSVMVIGPYRLSSDGTLMSGILAKDARIQVAIRKSRYVYQKKRQKVKAGKKIRFSVHEGAYLVSDVTKK